jgi:hypothetical protein
LGAAGAGLGVSGSTSRSLQPFGFSAGFGAGFVCAEALEEIKAAIGKASQGQRMSSSIMRRMERLQKLIGHDSSLRRVSDRIRSFAQDLRPAVVGAHQVNCSDESERECVEIFHSVVVRPLLPKLKYWAQSSFRTVNLGCRYEPESIGIAENHYATEASMSSFKLLIVKINSHVSLTMNDGHTVFGRSSRYDKDSVYCGALTALLAGQDAAFARELREVFSMHDIDRVTYLTTQCDEHERMLYAAICNSALQAQLAVRDAMTNVSSSPTCYLILSAVTLNRQTADSELVTGFHFIDEREEPKRQIYHGLGSDPSRYRWEEKTGKIIVTEKDA